MLGASRNLRRTVAAIGTGNFTVSTTTASINAEAGTTVQYTINISNTTANSLSLSVSGLPTGFTGSFNTSTTPANGNFTRYLSVSVPSNASANTYSFTVSVTDGTNTKTLSLSITVTVVKAAKINLVATTISPTSIKLDWVYDKGTSGPTTPTFEIIKTIDNAPYISLGTTQLNTFTDGTVSFGHNYTYTITFTYTSGGVPIQVTSNTAIVSITTGPPDAPGNFSATGTKMYSTYVMDSSGTPDLKVNATIKQGKVTFTWTTPNANGYPLTGYRLYQESYSNPGAYIFIATIPASATSFTTEVAAVNGTEGVSSNTNFKLSANNAQGSTFTPVYQTKVWRFNGPSYLTGSGTWKTSGRFINQIVFIGGGGAGGYSIAGGGGGAGEFGRIIGEDAASLFGSADVQYSVGTGGQATSSSGGNGGITSFGNDTPGKLIFGGGGGGGGGTSVNESLQKGQAGTSGGSGGGGARFYYGAGYSTPGAAGSIGSTTYNGKSVDRRANAGAAGLDSDSGAPPAEQTGGGGGGAGGWANGRTGGAPVNVAYADGTMFKVGAGGSAGYWNWPNDYAAVAGSEEAYAGSGGAGGGYYKNGGNGKDGVIVIEYWY